MNLKTFFAYDPEDTDETRLEKFAIFLVAGACTLAGLVWISMYYIVFGWGLTTMLPLLFVFVVGGALIISHISKNHTIVIYAQIISIIYITAFIQWSIGDVFDSGFVMVWAFLGPICALMFFSVKRSVIWFLLYLANLSITVIFNGFFASHGQLVTENIRLIFFIMNLGTASVVIFVFASYYVNAAIREHEIANQLLKANLQQELVLRQNEKLATLGRLSAGVAHELNNPAAATQRGSQQLQDAIVKLEKAGLRLGRLKLSAPQLEVLESQKQLVHQRAAQPVDLDPLARNDLELELEPGWKPGA